MDNIILIGFMGTGKSTVGRLLAEKLGMRFVDMDQLIEERERRSISEIFAVDGEQHFRALESDLVRELALESGLVIATGGGVVLDPRNIETFERCGLVVCLNASPETILARVESDNCRPLLEHGDKLARIESMLDSRASHYAQVEHQIDTDGLKPESIAVLIVNLCSENQALL